MTDRLYRHPTDRAIAGVAAGIAAWLNVDPSLVRIAWVLLAIFSGGIFVLVYIVMVVVVPTAPPGWTPRGGGTPGPYPGQAPYAPYPGQAPYAPYPGQAPYPGPAPDPGAWDPAAPGATPPPPDWTPAGGPPNPMASPGGWPPEGPSPAPAPPSSPPKGVSTGNAGIVAGVILVVLGAWFLVDQFVQIDWTLLLPVIFVLVGGALIAGALLRGRAT